MQPRALKRLEKAVRADGFDPHNHRSKDSCSDGCPQCYNCRDALRWPKATPLWASPVAYKKDVLEKLCRHYQLS